MPADAGPPPGEIHEHAERAAEYVRRALGLPLDYTPETLPVLDHYLRGVPGDRPEAALLVAAAAGAYFGEVARRLVGGEWDTSGAPAEWSLVLTGGLRLSPVAMAIEAILGGEAEGIDAGFEVPDAQRDAVEEALAAQGDVPEDEYYSLSGRLEILVFVVELLARRSDMLGG